MGLGEGPEAGEVVWRLFWRFTEGAPKIHYQGWWQPLNVLYRASWKGQMLHEAPDSAHHFWIVNFFKLQLRMFPSSGVPDV